MGHREDIAIEDRVQEKSQEKTERPKRFRVILHNDDYTPMEFVVRVLYNIFNQPLPKAVALMLKVHREGHAVAGIYPAQIAETKIQAVHTQARDEGYPLLCTMEPE